MNLKILASLLTIGVASAATGYGTFAFFNDTETALDNLFTAGDLDLTLNGLNGITATLSQGNLAPGDSRAGSILIRNEGSIHTGDLQGHLVDLDFKASVRVVDDLGNPADPDDGGVSTIPLSRFLTLTTFTYNDVSLLGQIGDKDGDSVHNTLADLQAAGVFKDLVDPLAGGKHLNATVLFLTSAPNHLKRDMVDVDFTFFLAQQAEGDLL